MNIFETYPEWRAYRNNIPTTTSIGFIPTMGALHLGHLSLIEASQKENEKTIVSIFVNPTQFNQAEDFQHYPRTLEQDLTLLKKVKADVCILPNANEMYADAYRFKVSEDGSNPLMEAVHRPGHFNGVLTVVMKLLNWVRPTRIYFGEKDFQQYQFIRDMAESFFLDVEVKAHPTIRESSGLPLSSRNQRLNIEQLKLAEQFAQLFHQSMPIPEMIKAIQSLGIAVDYIEEHWGRRFAAINIDGIRLIDNRVIMTI